MSFLLALALQAAAPAQDCQVAIGPLHNGADISSLPNQIDGATIRGVADLARLRAERGAGPLFINGGNLARADFRRARIGNICFIGTDLSGSDWRGADARGIAFVRADLTGADLSGARIPRVLIRDAKMDDVNAERAVLAEGRFDGGWFDGSINRFRLDGADLTGFRFDCGTTITDGCPVSHGRPQISLRNANLTRAEFPLADDLTGTRIDGTVVGPGSLPDLSVARIEGPILVRGDDVTAELSPEDYRMLQPHILRPDEAPAPSFDCGRAVAPVESLICGQYGGELRALDLTVAALFRRAGASARDSQRAWLAARDRCLTEAGAADYSCIRSRYEERRELLVAQTGPPEWLRPGETALFVAAPIEFDPAFQSHPLYRRLVPALIGSAYSRVLVRANGDGTIDARGDAFGPNGHMCDLTGDRLRFDRETGYYSGPYTPTGDEPVAWRKRLMPVLLLWDDRAAVYRHGQSTYGVERGDPRMSEYAGCGARAFFGEMTRMPIPVSEARALFDAYQGPY